MSRIGHQVNCDTQTSISSQFHGYPCKEHRGRRWSRRMPVGNPGMKREQSGENSKPNKGKRKIKHLYICWDTGFRNFQDVETIDAVNITVKIDPAQSNKNKC